MNPFKRMMERLGLLRVSPRGRRELFQPHEDDNGDAAAGGVTARLPKVPPRFSPGYAQAIPHKEKVADACAVGVTTSSSEKLDRARLLVA